MNQRRTDEDRLRAALTATPAPPVALHVDPAAARRAGERRAHARNALIGSGALSLVVVAGLGAVFIASHRVRPTALGSEQATVAPSATPSVSPSTGAAESIRFSIDPTPPVAGRPAALTITGTTHATIGGSGVSGDARVAWGDGSGDGRAASLVTSPVCSPAAAGFPPITMSHTYSAGGTYLVAVTVQQPGCGPAELASYMITVLGDGTTTMTPATPSATTTPATAPPPAATLPAVTTATASPAAGTVTSAAVPVQSGYAGDEAFCGAPGRLAYTVTGGSVSLTARLRGLQPGQQYAVDWVNGPTRAGTVDTVGTVTAAADGSVAAGSLRLVRPGETRGVRVLLVPGHGPTVTLTPC